MNELNRLRLSAIVLTVLWIAFMLWWTGINDIVSTGMMTLSGLIVGATWYGAMRGWAVRRSVARSSRAQ